MLIAHRGASSVEEDALILNKCSRDFTPVDSGCHQPRLLNQKLESMAPPSLLKRNLALVRSNELIWKTIKEAIGGKGGSA